MLAMKEEFKSTRPSGRVGKKIGEHFYIHKSAIHTLPFEIQLLVNETAIYLPSDFQYEVVKIHEKEGTVSFISSPDWDLAPEPTVGDSFKIHRTGTNTFTKGRINNKQIYHHKWLFVEDSYTGFDVEESKRRSEQWENSPVSFDKKKIGNSNYWNQTVLPHIETNEVRVDLTSLKQVAAVFKDKRFSLGPVNLDIGGGKFDLGTDYLRSKGIMNLIYDTYTRRYDYNQQILNTVKHNQIDSVTVANVLNVVRDEQERLGIIAQAANSVKEEGLCYFQIYEGDRSGNEKITSKKTWQANRKTAEYIPELCHFFGEVTRRGNILMCSGPIRNGNEDLLRKQARQWKLRDDEVFVVDRVLQF